MRGSDLQSTLFDLQEPELEPQAHEGPEVLVGTSGYSFADWKGTYYPPKIAARDMLIFYARDFSTVEINASYYRLLPPRTYQSMLGHVPADFTFVVKAHQDVTHSKELEKSAVQQFEDSIEPLKEARRLDAILLQFPWSFRNTPENQHRLKVLSEYLPEQSLVAELRNDSWDVPDTEKLLHNCKITYCCVDEPHLKGLMPNYTLVTTRNLGYVRLHGRNAKQWWKGGALRYDYDYSEGELNEWGDKIQGLMKKTGRVFAFFNNCHLGQAVKNAKMLRDLLKERGLQVR